MFSERGLAFEDHSGPARGSDGHRIRDRYSIIKCCCLSENFRALPKRVLHFKPDFVFLVPCFKFFFILTPLT